jgi:hypothetical protein
VVILRQLFENFRKFDTGIWTGQNQVVCQWIKIHDILVVLAASVLLHLIKLEIHYDFALMLCLLEN